MKPVLKSYQTKKPLYVVLFRIIVVLIIYSISRFIFYQYNKQSFGVISFSELATIFYGGIKFDLVPIVYTNALYVLAFLLPFKIVYNKHYKFIWNTFFVITNSLVFAIILTDTIYFKTVQNRLILPVIRSLTGENKLFSMFFRYSFDYWYFTLVLILFIAMLIYSTIVFDYYKKESGNKIFRFIKEVSILFLSAGIMLGFARGTFIPSSRPVSFGNAGKYTSNSSQIPIVLNTPFCLINSYETNELKELKFFSDNLELNKYCQPYHKANHTIKSRQNIVIIILESFGKEYIGSLNPGLEGGKYKGYTPFLDSLMKESRVFCNAFSNGRKSIDALPAIIASIPSLENPYIISPYVGNKITTVANLLKQEGYKSLFFHGGYNGSMGFEAFMNIAGFDKYYGYNEFPDKSKEDGYWGIWDEDFFQFFAATLNATESPFLGVFFSLSSHTPYDLPAQYKNTFPKGTLPIHETIGYTDHSLKKFFESARKMPWFDSTLFVITADHPSIAFYKEYISDMAFFKIPIVLYCPSKIIKGTDSTIVQHIDILPTIMNYIGYNKPYFSLGNDMLNDSTDHYAVVNNIGAKVYCVIWKNNVLYYYDGKLTGIYDINDNQMLHNLFDKRKMVIPDMELRYKAFLQQFNNSILHDSMRY